MPRTPPATPTPPPGAPEAAPLPGVEELPGLRVAVLGATGLVGRAMLTLLESSTVPVAELRPLASARPGARTVRFRDEELAVEPVSREALEGLDLVLASAGGAVSREWLPIAAQLGATCIDNTSAFRMDPEVPLVVPEVNGHLLEQVPEGGSIIANPNCSTIQLVVALEPLRQAFGLRSVQVSTYQSVSGAGRAALERFRAACAEVLRNSEVDGPRERPEPPAFDVLPWIGEADEHGHTTEERKMMNETPKILGIDLPLDVTCVRVPVFVGHAEAVVVRTERPATVEAAREALAAAPGVVLHDDGRPLTPGAVVGSRAVHVDRVRGSRTASDGLQFWVVADNLLKGAAWNAVQIAEALHACRARTAPGTANK